MKHNKKARRYDYDGQITSVEQTPQGFLKVPGYATRTGVFPYTDPTGVTRYELRHPDDVFSAVSLASLSNCPVTLEHPPVMVGPDNYRLYSKGYTTDKVQIDNGMIACDLIIADERAIDAIQNQGMRELSSGYTADIEEEEGVFQGQKYQFRQTNIVYNHVAVVAHGRAGPEVRLRMDSADAAQTPLHCTVTGKSSTKKDSDMDEDQDSSSAGQLTLSGGESIDLPAEIVSDIVSAMMDRYTSMCGQLNQVGVGDSMAKRNDVEVNQKNISPQVEVVQSVPDGRGGTVSSTLKQPAPQIPSIKDNPNQETKDAEGGEINLNPKDQTPAAVNSGDDVASMKQAMAQMKDMIDQMMAKVDEMSSSKTLSSPPVDQVSASSKMDSASVRQVVKNRVKLEMFAGKILPKEVSQKFDSMSDDQIRSAVILQKHPKADLSGKSATYIHTRFDSIYESFDESESVRREMGKSLLSEKMDSNEIDPNSARLRMIQSSREEWKQPTSVVNNKFSR